MKLRRALPVLGLVLVVGATALYARKRKPAAPDAPKQPLAVQFSGCARVDRGPVCVIRDKQRLTLFVPSTSTSVSIGTLAGPVPHAERELVEDGARYVVQVPLGPPELVVELENARFTLPLAKAEESAELERARALRTQGKTEEAERLLRSGLETLPALERGRRHALLGRILIARGKQEEGQRMLADASDSAEKAGRVSDAAEDALVLAFAQTVYERRFSTAREVVARARRLAKVASALEAAHVAYFAGILANASGDRTNGLDLFREAKGYTNRLAIHPLMELVTHQIALNLADLGRIDEGLALLRSVFPKIEDDSPCNRVAAHTDLAWLLLISHRENPPRRNRDEAHEHLDRAAALAVSSCKDPLRTLDVHITKAEWALASEDLASAKSELKAMKPFASEGTKLMLWRVDIEARQLLLAGDPRAAKQHFEREAALADASLDIEGHWRSQVGLGAALARLGRKKEAMAAYGAAESDLDRMLVSVPLSEGRDSFAGARDLSARRLVALLASEGQTAEALAVARWARIRALRSAVQIGRVSQLSSQERAIWDNAIGKYRKERASLEAAADGDWKLASDALSAARRQRADTELRLRGHLNEAYRLIAADRALDRKLALPARGELFLMFFPSERGFLAFVLDEQGASVESVGDIHAQVQPAELAARLLTPFANAIRGVNRIRFLTYGEARSVDLHALPFDGAPLGHGRAVEYALDVEPSPNRAGVGTLVVADPRSDLPLARLEGEQLERTLAARTGLQAMLHEGDDASRERVLGKIPHARWLHFAGHGTFSEVNGADSALEVADGRLTVGDILALPRVPELVVLNACDAAREVQRSTSESFGVAQAFLVRGARGVIAPTRPVKDELSHQLATELYAELLRTPDPAGALGRATATIAKRDPKADWAAFRAFSP